MKLVIVESPNKVKTISKYLGKEYVVLPTVGHTQIIDSVGAYRTGIDVNNGFKVSYKWDPTKKDVLKNIKTAAKDVDEIYIASDPDREGEAISHEMRELLSTHKKKIKRVIFHEITETAVKNAIANPIPFDEKMIDAAHSRQVLDRLLGYRCSPIALSKINCESVGRVQSALLGLICEREEKIQKFKSTKYYDIFMDFKKGNKKLTAKLKSINNKNITKIEDKSSADTVVSDCKDKEFLVERITEKTKSVEPKLPFTTSSLQQTAGATLGYNPQKTMTAAQHLFEKGYISYHRTDSVRFSDDFIESAKTLIVNTYGKSLYRGLNVPASKNENAQNGHESIRPTDLSNTPSKISSFLDTAELKLYTLIYNRSLAALFVPAKVKNIEVIINYDKYRFSISGKEIVFESFLQLYNDDTENEILPSFSEGEKINVKDIYSVEKDTQPPARYSEAGLTDLMEKTGIGRPSSFAGTIETLKKREYISIEKKAVHATEKGMKLNKMLKEYFSEVINTEYTAQMEAQLDKIANGEMTRLEMLTKFWKEFEPLCLKAAREINKDKPKPELAGKKCPKCGKDLVIRESKYGKFLTCSGFPKCRYTGNLEEKQKVKPVSTGYRCPECGEGEMIQRKSKAGEVFYGCSRFPKCKKTIKFDVFQKLTGKDPEMNFSDSEL